MTESDAMARRVWWLDDYIPSDAWDFGQGSGDGTPWLLISYHAGIQEVCRRDMKRKHSRRKAGVLTVDRQGWWSAVFYCPAPSDGFSISAQAWRSKLVKPLPVRLPAILLYPRLPH